VMQWTRDNAGEPFSVSSDLADIVASVRERICAWDARTTAAAAGVGHLEVLQWASNSGCALDDTACWAAALGGHLPVLRWLSQQAPRCEWAGWDYQDVAAAVTADDSDQDADVQRRHVISAMRYAVKRAPGTGSKWSATIAVMRATIGNAELQDWGMRTMCKLAINHPDTVTSLGAAGACEVALAGMRAHPSITRVQSNSMYLLAELAHSGASTRAALGAAGACEAVAAALRAHVSNAMVQISGAEAVVHLAIDNGINKARLCKAGAFEAVLQAWQRTRLTIKCSVLAFQHWRR
jgi:hypothetical protein